MVKVLDRIEYICKSGTVYTRTFNYDSSGNLVKSVLVRNPKDGKVETVDGKYFSPNEFSLFNDCISKKKMDMISLRSFFDIKGEFSHIEYSEEEYSGDGGIIIILGKSGGGIKLKRSGIVEKPPRRIYKNLELMASEHNMEDIAEEVFSEHEEYNHSDNTNRLSQPTKETKPASEKPDYPQEEDKSSPTNPYASRLRGGSSDTFKKKLNDSKISGNTQSAAGDALKKGYGIRK